MGHVQSYHPVLKRSTPLPKPDELTRKELEERGMTCGSDGRLQLPKDWELRESYTDGRALTTGMIYDSNQKPVAVLRSTQSQYCISPTNREKNFS